MHSTKLLFDELVTRQNFRRGVAADEVSFDEVSRTEIIVSWHGIGPVLSQRLSNAMMLNQRSFILAL